jgi:hypothetical protein
MDLGKRIGKIKRHWHSAYLSMKFLARDIFEGIPASAYHPLLWLNSY